MGARRSRLELIYDILLAIQNKGGQIKPTHLMYKSNLSHKLLNHYLEELMTKELVAVEEIGTRGRPGHALLALGRSGQNEMPRLGVGARRAEAEQVANGLHVAFRYPLVGIVELGGVAGLGSVDDCIAGPHERGEGGHDMGS